MKKKCLLMLVATLIMSTFAFTGCAGQTNESEENTSRRGVRNTADIEDEEDEDEENSKKGSSVYGADELVDIDECGYMASFYGGIEEYAEGEYYMSESTISYELDIVDEESCVLSKYINYGDNFITYNYAATYNYNDEYYELIINDGYDDLKLLVYVEGDNITKVVDKTGSSDYSSIVGEKSFRSELGFVEFKVTETGLADDVIIVDGNVVEASLFVYDADGEDYMYEPEWDLTFSYGEEYYDWYLYFNKRGISYQPYREAVYEKYAGVYEMDGELGAITVDVDEMGNALADVKLGGEMQSLQGSVGYDSYEGCIVFDLYNENCTLHLIVDQFEDATMYRGSYTITTEMAAG